MSKDDLHKIVERVAVRVVKRLRKHGYVGQEDDAGCNETRALSFDEMLAQAASQRGTIENVKGSRDESDASGGESSNARPPPCDGAVTFSGFNLHASVRIAAHDDVGRERVFRYCLRPPFSLERLQLLTDGRVYYRVKKSGRRAARCRIMTPIECLARLCALVPPPYYPRKRGFMAC